MSMQTQPLTWACPVGLDVLALSGTSDIGQEMAQYRERVDDDDDEEGGDAPASIEGATAP